MIALFSFGGVFGGVRPFESGFLCLVGLFR